MHVLVPPNKKRRVDLFNLPGLTSCLIPMLEEFSWSNLLTNGFLTLFNDSSLFLALKSLLANPIPKALFLLFVGVPRPKENFLIDFN